MERVIRQLVQYGDAEDNKQDAEEAVDVDVLAEEQIEHSDEHELGKEHHQPDAEEHEQPGDEAWLILQPGDDCFLEQECQVRQYL